MKITVQRHLKADVIVKGLAGITLWGPVIRIFLDREHLHPAVELPDRDRVELQFDLIAIAQQAADSEPAGLLLTVFLIRPAGDLKCGPCKGVLGSL